MCKKLGLSVDFGGTTIKCSLMDFNGNQLFNWTFNTISGNAYKNLDNIYNSYLKKIKENNINDSDVIGYSIGVPGPVSNGKVSFLVNVGVDKEIDIESYLNNLFKKDGCIYNDAYSCWYGECDIRNTSHEKILLMLGTGTGICTKNGNEELGHVVILDYGENRIDNKGIHNSIETYCSQIGILETYKNYCKKYNIKYDKDITIIDIFKKDNKAKEDTVNTFLNVHLVDGIIELIKMYPDTYEIILGGGISNGIDIKYIEDLVNKKLNKKIIVSKAIYSNSLYGLNRLLNKKMSN